MSLGTRQPFTTAAPRTGPTPTVIGDTKRRPVENETRRMWIGIGILLAFAIFLYALPAFLG